MLEDGMFLRIWNLLRVGTVTCAALFLSGSGASAATYVLNERLGLLNHGSESNLISFSSPASWMVDGAVPSTCPQSGDAITWPGISTWGGTAYLALDVSHEVASMSDAYKCFHLFRATGAASESVSLTFSKQLGTGGYQHYWLHSGTRLVLPAGSAFLCSLTDHTPTTLLVGKGAEAEIRGSVQSRALACTVESGGSLVFAPTAYASVNQRDSSDGLHHDHDEFIISGGRVFFPDGIRLTGTTMSSVPQQINLSHGTVEFGGDFVSSIPWAFAWSGGTLKVTASVEFGANVAVTIPASANVTLDVAPGASFAVRSFDADPTAVVTKTGPGMFAITPATRAFIRFDAGSLALSASGAYDLSKVTVGAGVKPSVRLLAMGARIDALPPAFSDSTFEADFADVSAGTVVFCSADPAVLDKAMKDLSKSLPADRLLVKDGDAITLESKVGHTFAASGDILSPAGWGGALPPAGASVAIDGAGVVAKLTYGVFPAWKSLEIRNGATLRITKDVTLPPLALNKNARLEIANESVVTLARAGDLSCVATARQLPILHVDFNSSLNVPGGMKFSNVMIELEMGMISVTTPGGVTFGYAGTGETAYFGLVSKLGTISLTPGEGDYDSSPLEFCCPAPSGDVKTVGDLVLTETTILPLYERAGITYGFTPPETAFQIGFCIGVNNPESSPFELVFDNTSWGVCAGFSIRGGATLRLVNGGKYMSFESVGYFRRRAQIAEKGRLVVGRGCEFRLNSMGDYGIQPYEIRPSSPNHRAIVVEDGGIFENYRFSGNGNGVYFASNSSYRIYMPSQYHVYYSTTTGAKTVYDTRNIPFEGFASVELAEGATLDFTTRNKLFWDEGQFDESSGARVVALADVPISGVNASIRLSNADRNDFGVVVRSGRNTATGTASVATPAAGIGATTLYFADGANWAGTVVAGNVAFTNLVEAAAGAAVTFNNLRIPSGRLVVRRGDRLSIDGVVQRQNGDKGMLVLEDGPSSLRARKADAFAVADVRSRDGRRLALKPSASPDERGYYTFTVAK